MQLVRPILIVEDNPADVRLIQEALKPVCSSIELYSAENGEEALTLLKETKLRPELVFLDFNLPRTDLGKLLFSIRSDGDLRDLPVAVLTSSLSEKDMHRAYEAGADCFLVKPPALDEFFQVIASATRFWLRL